MTVYDYLDSLRELETKLLGHASPWGSLYLDESSQELLAGWQRVATHLKKEHPEAVVPRPFWERVGKGPDVIGRSRRRS